MCERYFRLETDVMKEGKRGREREMRSSLLSLGCSFGSTGKAALVLVKQHNPFDNKQYFLHKLIPNSPPPKKTHVF